jgi:hypothetical protein
MAALTQIIIDDKHLLPEGVTKVKDLSLRAGDAIYVHALEALIAWIQEKSRSIYKRSCSRKYIQLLE